MGLLHRGRAMLNRRLGQAGGVSVTYSRKAESRSLAAADGVVWVGQTAFASNTQGGARLEWGDRDYLILASALAWLRSPDSRDGEPAVGDRIAETIDGVEMVFEVMNPSTGEQAWRPSGTGMDRYRLHVKRVA